MASKLIKTEQLKRLKEIRRMSAERRLIRAKVELSQKEALLVQASHIHDTVCSEANDIRMKRLEAIFGAEKQHGMHQTIAINTYFQTDEEMEAAREAVEQARILHKEALDCVKTRQSELAQKMLQQDKAERLNHSVAYELRMEAARQE